MRKVISPFRDATSAEAPVVEQTVDGYTYFVEVKPFADNAIVSECPMQCLFKFLVAVDPAVQSYSGVGLAYPYGVLCVVASKGGHSPIGVGGGADLDCVVVKRRGSQEVDVVGSHAPIQDHARAVELVVVHVPTPGSNGLLTCAG